MELHAIIHSQSFTTLSIKVFSIQMKKARLVFIPSPGAGHLIATVEFSKHLIERDDRLFITVLVMKPPIDTKIGSYIESLASSSLTKRVEFVMLPDDFITNSNSNLRSFLITYIENQKPHVRGIVSKIADSNSGRDSPRLAGFVVDMFCTTMGDVAREFGVPMYVFFTSGTGFLGLMFYAHMLRERDNLDVAELKESGVDLAISSFQNPVPARVLPTTVLEKEWRKFFFDTAERLMKAKGVIVNTFEELESHAVHSFSGNAISIYAVGPILNLDGGDNNMRPDGAQQESDIMKWLDDQPEASVVFLCFGSRGCFSEVQVREMARALENSGVRFLWALQKPPPQNARALPSDYPNLAEILPEGFLDRTVGIGKVTGWAPQVKILSHKSIGGFVSHCGWNSILESIYFGVPIATWPLYAEQQLNAFELVKELKLSVEISLDYRLEFMTLSKAALSAEIIEKGIRDLMEKNSEIRKNVKEMSEKSRKTLIEGGCSHSSLGCLIDDIINFV